MTDFIFYHSRFLDCLKKAYPYLLQPQMINSYIQLIEQEREKFKNNPNYSSSSLSAPISLQPPSTSLDPNALRNISQVLSRENVPTHTLLLEIKHITQKSI